VSQKSLQFRTTNLLTKISNASNLEGRRWLVVVQFKMDCETCMFAKWHTLNQRCPNVKGFLALGAGISVLITHLSKNQTRSLKGKL
jgi:hypothetical protein